MEKLAFVQGGFSKIGGIESFASDLLRAFRSRHIPVRLICWNAGGANPTLDGLVEAEIPVERTQWRWGCRWGWPDKVMARSHWRHLVDSELLVFGKVLHEDLHRQLSLLRKRMVLVTPYRPSEMWQDKRPDPSLLNSFESIVIQASSFEEELRTFGYRGRIVKLPYLPPNVNTPSPWPRTVVLQVGFLGRLVPDKNVKYLLDAFSRLRVMGTEARLHIYGDGPERNELQNLAAQREVADQVRFHGSKSRADVANAIDRCHIFAFSSLTEGQCLAALEILARGRPVVGTPVGAFPDFLQGPLGCLAPLNDADVYAAALRATGRPVLEAKIGPADVQQAYLRCFNRANVIEEYARLFGCIEQSERKVQIA